ncbi:MAG TPA: Holliday junction resolvase RuvX [Gammaproteobacteria bacterium]|nr:Holliday junction resolvase RuvX [Gammaproteobacteria bacterium]
MIRTPHPNLLPEGEGTSERNQPFYALGFDFGLRRIGIAVGQSLTATAGGLGVVAARDGEPDWEAIERLAAEWHPQALVVGLPYNADGSEQPLTARARDFARALGERLDLPVSLVDERLSSHAAETELKDERQAGRRRLRKGDIDSRAARLILESWLREFEKLPH